MNVIVVGAGIAGLSTAWALVRRGVTVTLLEQGPVPNPLSASGDQHRIIRRAYGGQGGYQRRISDAYAAWDEMWDDLGARHLVDTGFLLLSQEPGDEGERYRTGMIAGGYALDEMSGAEAEARYPFLDGQTLRFAAFNPEGGVLLCREIAAGLRDWLRARGADLRERTRVTAIDRAAGAVTLADGAVLTADRVVVTAGAWVTQLAPDLAPTLTPYRTAVVYLEPPADLKAAWAAAPVILDVGGKVDGYVLPPVPGTGLKFGAGIHKYRNADANANRLPVPGEGETLRDHFAPPFARIAEYRVTDVVTCAYTFTADEHFFVRDDGRTVFVSACSGHGYKFGAVVGQKIAAGLLSGDIDTARIWLEARD
ncbi:NAD(P)/FAD-dependent oxidoreductase [Pannonibacter tanglangensis]|uniref:FAD-dependent oxidoreductase n=1 Tax=Pannonibacter tanglangensis TaxID=2750084 RepID=A0ABW9ZF27_9HYPH|nr:FAD-dependent oxidoreductase [Pannonibacter sp. XCT-34]NBN63311.1 FAD-dependent oxidoreductase [Pannonibacter sp. XCT-34]